MAAPWIVKDWIYIGNPTVLFANRYFQNPNIHISFYSAIGPRACTPTA